MTEGLLTTKEVLECLRVSLTTLHRLRRSGELKSVRLGAHAIRFRREDVEHLIEARLTQENGR